MNLCLKCPKQFLSVKRKQSLKDLVSQVTEQEFVIVRYQGKCNCTLGRSLNVGNTFQFTNLEGSC